VRGADSGASYEGAFASRVLAQNLETLAPFSSALGAWTAASGGLLQGRFGFGDPLTGLVTNMPTGPNYVCAVVVPLESTNGANGAVIGGPARFGGPQARWTWQTFDPIAKSWRMREGIVVTLMDQGNFWLRFPGGANYGDTVYASLTDGSAQSGAVSGAIATVFKVCGNASAGRLAIVSSSAKFN
jgi:hypothetical protein